MFNNKVFVPTSDPVVEDYYNYEIDKIIRREKMAVETYNKIMCSLADINIPMTKLKSLKKDHEQAIQYWRSQTRLKSSKSSEKSGVWGSIVHSLAGATTYLGDKVAIRALRNGEQYGLKTYQEMLDSELLSDQHKEKIANTFIPIQKHHINEMGRVMRRIEGDK